MTSDVELLITMNFMAEMWPVTLHRLLLQKDNRINTSQEPVSYSLSHRWCKARLKPAEPVLGCRWRPPGHHGPSVAGRQHGRAEEVSRSRLRLTCHRSLCGYLAPVRYEELFHLTAGPVLVTAGQNPRLPRGVLSVVRVSAKPHCVPLLHRAGQVLSQGGSKRKGSTRNGSA